MNNDQGITEVGLRLGILNLGRPQGTCKFPEIHSKICICVSRERSNSFKYFEGFHDPKKA